VSRGVLCLSFRFMVGGRARRIRAVTSGWAWALVRPVSGRCRLLVSGRSGRGGPRRAAGSIRAAAAPPGGGGQTCRRSRAARVRACSPGLGEDAAGGGQRPDLPVAHRVEDAGEQLAGRRDLGDVLRFAAAAVGDAVPELAGRAAGGLVPAASTMARRRVGEPCLVMCPRATLTSDSRCRGVSPAQLHS
jgi:hypothetical protein